MTIYLKTLSHVPPQKRRKPLTQEIQQVGLYTLEEGFLKLEWPGTLYWAKHVETSATFIIHKLHRDEFPWLDERQWKSFRADLEQLLIFSHPSLLTYKDILNIEETTYLISEAPRLPSRDVPKTLKELLEQLPKGKLVERDALAALLQLAEGVQYLHAQGMIHQLLQDEAIFIDWGQKPLRLKVGLYGLAALLPKKEPPPPSLNPYLPPEFREERASHPRSDIYSLGILLWQMLTGENTQPSLEHFRTAEAGSIVLPIPRFSRATQSIFEKTISTNVEERHTHLQLLIQQLQKAVQNDLTSTAEPLPITTIAQFYPQVDEAALPPEEPIAYEEVQDGLKKTLEALIKNRPGTSKTLRPLPEKIPESWEQEALQQGRTQGASHTPMWFIPILLLLATVIYLIFRYWP
ncbi:MAG: hypothetical protein CL920_34255 [Deltaproteobacteria bacterium]|nr:hypothetical protein [Deltaproteobacteria bacterium]MBU53787.1 hypothetical protein [Deltaproteobacteria bacterium]